MLSPCFLTGGTKVYAVTQGHNRIDWSGASASLGLDLAWRGDARRVYSCPVSITTTANLVVLKESQNVMKVIMKVSKRLTSKTDMQKMMALACVEISEVGGNADCGSDCACVDDVGWTTYI